MAVAGPASTEPPARPRPVPSGPGSHPAQPVPADSRQCESRARLQTASRLEGAIPVSTVAYLGDDSLVAAWGQRPAWTAHGAADGRQAVTGWSSWQRPRQMGLLGASACTPRAESGPFSNIWGSSGPKQDSQQGTACPNTEVTNQANEPPDKVGPVFIRPSHHSPEGQAVNLNPSGSSEYRARQNTVGSSQPRPAVPLPFSFRAGA